MNTCSTFCSWSRTLLNLISAISCSVVIRSFLKLEEKPLGHKVIATLSFTDFIFHIFQIFLIWLDPGYPLSGSVIGMLTNTTVQFSIFWSSCMAYVIYQSFHSYDKNQQGNEDKFSQRRYLRLLIPCLSLVFILATLSTRPSENQILYRIMSYGFNTFALGAIAYYYTRAIYLIKKFPDMVRQTLQKTIRVLFAYLIVQMATIAPIIIRNFLVSYFPLWSLRIDYLLALLICLTGTANSQIFFWQKRNSATRRGSVWTQEQNSSYVSLDSIEATL